METKNKEEIEYHNRLWYYKTYNSLVDKALQRGLDKRKLEGYYEKHHILPKCLGGKDENNNYVLLTAREHVLAHMLLQRIYPNNYKLINSMIAMLTLKNKFNKDHRLDKLISSKSASYYRELFANSLRGNIPWNAGKSGIYSDKTKEIMSNKKLRKHLTEEHRKKISISVRKNISNNKTIVGPDGTIYSSMSQCAEIIGINRCTLRDWIKNHPEKGFSVHLDSTISKLEFSKKKIIDKDGIIYDSVTACSKILGIDRRTVEKYIKTNPEKGFRYYTSDDQENNKNK